MTVSDERVVHSAMFAAPLGSVGTSALGVLGVVKTFADDTPLDGGGVAIVGGEAFLHTPRHRAMVEDDALAVLHVEACHRLVGDVAGTETYITNDDVVVVDVHVVAGEADAATWCRLSEDRDVGEAETQLRLKVNGTRSVEEDDAGTAAILVVERPTKRTFDEVVVRAVVVAGDVAYFTSTTTCDEASIALSARKGELAFGMSLRGCNAQHGAKSEQD